MNVAQEAAAFGKVDLRIKKYAPAPIGSLKALLQLEIAIYQAATRLFPPRTALLGVNLRPAESLVLDFLQDFNETSTQTIGLSQTQEAEGMKKLLGNQLAIYRTLWRFENYIKKIASLPTQNLGWALPGKLS